MDETNSAAGGLTLDQLFVKHANLVAAVATIGQTVSRLETAASQRQASREQAPDIDNDDLVAWVKWLINRYELGSHIPRCWPLHGALVEELAALHIAWLDAVGQAGTVGTQWHQHLSRALDRIDGRWRTCIGGTHETNERPAWLDEGPDGADTIDLDRDRMIER